MIRRLSCLVPLCLAVLLSGCVGIVIPGLEPEEPPAPPVRVLPAAVRAALLPGVPETIVVEDGRGCYLVSIQMSEPRQGYLVNDSTGAPLCYDAAGNRISRPADTAPVTAPATGPTARPLSGQAAVASDAAATSAGILPILPPA